ncbi:transcriptional regulator family: Fungal Specific TF [Penicillium roqueforti]|nr:transcriptional regulator family: Fungal Specific TF [Penicillium roqueforti]KAF9252862.1 transcriptional regulator family: Fungal Specific TF [Penicillium roqueforti]KAI1830636.1 transcriptional regulator family: Fungal Specific TF [Penicillium roqueforti]KAI2676041.1 transcriptional regulator family: Fungal Specific TF [Penicillium roqueforti]KAI2679272.1 transcriptional regulator family: Fungal Specific TF [Penicillium roqueforti]KAI2697880.1 transcriptional regulator family: Fungal Spec
MQNPRSPIQQPEVEQPAAKRIKRPRATQACDRCRLKKYKCNERYPCLHCKKSGWDCVYQGTYRERESSRSANYVAELEKKLEELTSKLRDTEAKASSKGPIPPAAETLCSMRNSSTPRDVPAISEAREGPREISDKQTQEFNHINTIECHSSTSPAAVIGHLKKELEPKYQEEHFSHAADYSIISTLRNPNLSPLYATGPGQMLSIEQSNYYFDQAHIFMNGYFESIHFIHPFVDKEDFFARANDLWFNRSRKPEPSFVALYLSVLSLGALVRVWDEGTLAGLGRFEWSRKLFGEAQGYLNNLRFSNDLETAQCLYMMAKVCQNELNPNLAYMYLGLAVRTCLSAGFNREIPCLGDTTERSGWISKTWWGLFSLEIEMSFSVGRPDTLGMDEYHNRSIPPRDDSEFAIIPWMIDFAQIIRQVSVQIYHSRISLQDKLQLALQIEMEMDRWLARLPEMIKPDIGGYRPSRSALRDPKWARRQRLVLGIRYYNVKMLLFRPFLSHFPRKLRHSPSELDQTFDKCLDAAMKTLQVLHDLYRVHTFFRCWWYNTTYIMLATSTLLLPMSRLGMCAETIPLLQSVEMGVEILEAMDECATSQKSVEIIRQYLRDFRASGASQPPGDDEAQSEAGQVFDVPEWAYGFGLPDYSFEGIAQLFDDMGDIPLE